MIVVKNISLDDALTIMTNPEIYDRITDDTCPKIDDFVMPKFDCEYIGGFIDGVLSSLYVVHGSKMHFMVLKESRRSARLLLERSFMFYGKGVFCIIPLCYSEVINFAKKTGFNVEGIIKASTIKNGVTYDALKMSRDFV